jgi:hypothetical protein
VETRKDIDAALEVPFRRMAIAVGNTPHEHKGKGTPIAAALITDFQPVPDKWYASVRCGMNACIIPAIKKPNRIYGDIPLIINRKVFNKFISVSVL